MVNVTRYAEPLRLLFRVAVLLALPALIIWALSGCTPVEEELPPPAVEERIAAIETRHESFRQEFYEKWKLALDDINGFRGQQRKSDKSIDVLLIQTQQSQQEIFDLRKTVADLERRIIEPTPPGELTPGFPPTAKALETRVAALESKAHEHEPCEVKP